MKNDVLFLDANVLFSAAYRESSGLLRLWELKSVKLISSAYAIEEARRNLKQQDQRERLDRLVIEIESFSFYKETIELPQGVSIKEKDKPILLAAIFAKADYLITGDIKDFGKFYGKKIRNVMILPPSDYLYKHKGLKK